MLKRIQSCDKTKFDWENSQYSIDSRKCQICQNTYNYYVTTPAESLGLECYICRYALSRWCGGSWELSLFNGFKSPRPLLVKLKSEGNIVFYYTGRLINNQNKLIKVDDYCKKWFEGKSLAQIINQARHMHSLAQIKFNENKVREISLKVKIR